MKVYLIIGDTGEYSDHCQWTVCAYTTRDTAEKRVAILKALAGNASVTDILDWQTRSEISKHVNTAEHGDPDAHIDYTGIDWRVEELELKEAL